MLVHPHMEQSMTQKGIGGYLERRFLETRGIFLFWVPVSEGKMGVYGGILVMVCTGWFEPDSDTPEIPFRRAYFETKPFDPPLAVGGWYQPPGRSRPLFGGRDGPPCREFRVLGIPTGTKPLSRDYGPLSCSRISGTRCPSEWTQKSGRTRRQAKRTRHEGAVTSSHEQVMPPLGQEAVVGGLGWRFDLKIWLLWRVNGTPPPSNIFLAKRIHREEDRDEQVEELRG